MKTHFSPTNFFASGVAALFLSCGTGAAKTPAETKIDNALKVVEAKPGEASVYAPLAFAYASRARETANGDYYLKGMEAVEKALKIDPKNYDARKAEAWILLGQHEFQKALEMTRALNKRSGDDPMVYAMRTDAAIETGNYKEAEEAAQWSLDMDAGGVPGLTRAAYLREHFGDFDGAIDLMKKSFNRVRSSDTEERAWILTHIGHLYLLKGEASAAERAHVEALKIFPDYHYALLNLAHTKSAQGKKEEALELHRRHYAAAGHPENLYELAKAMREAGKDSEADKAFSEFEKAALEESVHVDNANRELTAYYIDEANNPAEALRVANLEMANRQDWRTLYAHARALHANKRFKEARDSMSQALEVGVMVPEMQYHAGIIARDAGDRSAAKAYLEKARSIAVSKDLKELAEAAENALPE